MGKEPADAVIEGAEPTVAKIDGSDLGRVQLEARKVVVNAGQGVAIDRQSRVVGQILVVIEVLDAAGTRLGRR